MSIDKLNIRFNEPIYDQENIDKLKNKVNEVIDEVNDGSIKKIYCHPVYLYRDETAYGMDLTFLIFTNDSTPFTLATFKTWIDENLPSEGTLLCAGYYRKGTTIIVSTSFVYKAISDSTTTYGICGCNGEATRVTLSSTSFADIFNNNVRLIDNVNAIN